MPFLNLRVQKPSDQGLPEPAPEALRAQGPVFPVTLSHTDAVRRALRESGAEIASPVHGLALVDTGATGSCFDLSAARRAGLPVRGTSLMSSASHADHRVPLFSGKLLMQDWNINVETAMGVNLAGMPELIALIGRDLLEQAVLIYNGPEGAVTLAI